MKRYLIVLFLLISIASANILSLNGNDLYFFDGTNEIFSYKSNKIDEIKNSEKYFYVRSENTISILNSTGFEIEQIISDNVKSFEISGDKLYINAGNNIFVFSETGAYIDTIVNDDSVDIYKVNNEINIEANTENIYGVTRFENTTYSNDEFMYISVYGYGESDDYSLELQINGETVLVDGEIYE